MSDHVTFYLCFPICKHDAIFYPNSTIEIRISPSLVIFSGILIAVFQAMQRFGRLQARRESYEGCLFAAVNIFTRPLTLTLFVPFQVVSLRTKYMALDVLETELLPSDVIKVKFYRPPNFKYLSGQWVRLACTAFRSEEFHSFTLTSAPHENFLSCHIKAQGPWTWKLRNYFDPCNYNPEEDHPKVRNSLLGLIGQVYRNLTEHEM